MPDFVQNFFVYLLIMAGVTYLVRMLPLVLVKKKITNRFVRSFLYYIPYSVLSVMTVPAIFFATENVLSASVGCLIAVALSLCNRSLITVAACSATGVLVCEIFIEYLLPICAF